MDGESSSSSLAAMRLNWFGAISLMVVHWFFVSKIQLRHEVREKPSMYEGCRDTEYFFIKSQTICSVNLCTGLQWSINCLTRNPLLLSAPGGSNSWYFARLDDSFQLAHQWRWAFCRSWSVDHFWAMHPCRISWPRMNTISCSDQQKPAETWVEYWAFLCHRPGHVDRQLCMVLRPLQ